MPIPFFFNKVVAKGAFLSKVCPPIHAAVNAVMLIKQEALKKQQKGRHGPLLLLRKQVHDKRGIAESLHAQITRARLTWCVRRAYFREKYHNAHSPL